MGQKISSERKNINIKRSIAVAPFGSWDSPLDAGQISGERLGFGSPRVANNGKIYYLESRPSGAAAIVEVSSDGTVFRDVLPSTYSARSRVNEYGGSAYCLLADGKIVFTDFDTMIVHLLDPASGEIESVLDVKACRYADFDTHPSKPWLVAIEEDHTADKPSQVINRIVLIDLEKKSRKTLVEGNDFYMNPHISPDGSQLCWTEHCHPNMPWTGNKCMVAKFSAEGQLSNVKHIAGEDGKVSISEPRWSPAGELYFASDITGYYQLHRFEKDGSSHPIRLTGLEEVSICSTEWQLGNRDYLFLSNTKVLANANIQGASKLILVDFKTEKWEDLNIPLTYVSWDALAITSFNSFVVIGASDSDIAALYFVDIKAKGDKRFRKLKSTLEFDLSDEFKSNPVEITCPTADNLITHGFFFAPKNPNFAGPEDTRPPIIVSVHGGPTGTAPRSFDPEVQYYTTRGFAILRLNYRGSSAYGRKYIEQLNSVWGIADVQDAEAVVHYLASKGLIDGTRAGITGGSAGGYTTFQAMTVDRPAEEKAVFIAGVSLFGISDMRAMMAETHKFESHYLEALVFDPGMTTEQKQQRLKDRSAISHPERTRGSLLVLQGEEDKIVPKDQAEDFVAAAKKAGIDVGLILYPGEGHGFRKAETNKSAILEAEKLWRSTLIAG